MVDIYQTHHFEKERGRGNNVDLHFASSRNGLMRMRCMTGICTLIRDVFSGLKRSPVVPFIRE